MLTFYFPLFRTLQFTSQTKHVLLHNLILLVFFIVYFIMTSKNYNTFFQNFLFTSKDENSHLKAIDFGLSDFVKPGILLTGQSVFFYIKILVSNCQGQKGL